MPDKGRPREQAGPSFASRISADKLLVRVAGRKHQRLDRDRYDFSDPETFTDVDVVQIADFDTVHGDDVTRDLEFIFQHAAKRFGDVEIQRQIKGAFWIIGILENLRDSFRDPLDRLIIRYAAHGQRQSQTRSEAR